MLELDATPIATDYTNIRELFGAMRQAAEEHPEWVFLSADDPGHHHDPPRVPRVGWTAFAEGEADKPGDEWTIKLSDLKGQLTQLDQRTDRAMRRGLQSAAGRQRLLEQVIGRPGHPTITGDVWTLDQGLEFVREIEPLLRKNGWGVGLTGSVLTEGVSHNDLDLIVYPQNSTEVSHNRLRGILQHSFGMELKWDLEKVHQAWRRHDSKDCKHVEVWETKLGRRVDLFILR
jgi:hypothetical protein